MTIAQSIVHASTMIKMVCEWIDHEIRDGGFSTPDSMGQTYLATAEGILRELADEIAERRKALLANAPSALEPRHEPAA